MPAQVGRLDKCLVAHFAHIADIAGVNSFVCFQIRRLCEAFAAELANIRPFARMDALVALPTGWMGEGFVAELACVRSFTGVDALVSLKAGGVRERLATDIADMHSVIHVGALLVPTNLVGVAESFVTEPTFQQTVDFRNAIVVLDAGIAGYNRLVVFLRLKGTKSSVRRQALGI